MLWSKSLHDGAKEFDLDTLPSCRLLTILWEWGQILCNIRIAWHPWLCPQTVENKQMSKQFPKQCWIQRSQAGVRKPQSQVGKKELSLLFWKGSEWGGLWSPALLRPMYSRSREGTAGSWRMLHFCAQSLFHVSGMEERIDGGGSLRRLGGPGRP